MGGTLQEAEGSAGFHGSPSNREMKIRCVATAITEESAGFMAHQATEKSDALLTATTEGSASFTAHQATEE